MTIHLSCGHEAEDGCLGVCVEYADEQCVAGEGFVPCTVEAVYCHKCAMDLAAAEERAKIVAWHRTCPPHIAHCFDAADASENKEHL